MDPSPTKPPEGVLRLGISSCLHGEEVRYDGGHRRDDLTLSTIGRYVDWVPVCPEVELGLGVPRETLRLEGASEYPRLVFSGTRSDITDDMRKWSAGRVRELGSEDLDGYVTKKGSPSCGMSYDKNNSPSGPLRGIFALELSGTLPLLPIEEEGRLRDANIRENFVERLFAYHQLKRIMIGGGSGAELAGFHTAHKLTVMAHDPDAGRELDRLAADALNGPLDELPREYGRLFMRALSVWATRRKHADVLQYVLGHLDEAGMAGSADMAELLGIIDDYQTGLVPLIVPVTLLSHYLKRHAVPDWLQRQVYLYPHPKELLLRNHV